MLRNVYGGTKNYKIKQNHIMVLSHKITERKEIIFVFKSILNTLVGVIYEKTALPGTPILFEIWLTCHNYVQCWGPINVYMLICSLLLKDLIFIFISYYCSWCCAM